MHHDTTWQRAANDFCDAHHLSRLLRCAAVSVYFDKKKWDKRHRLWLGEYLPKEVGQQTECEYQQSH
jgi:hypothetical protein